MEGEIDETIDMLDVVARWSVMGRIETSVYRKPTNTNRYLNFRSNHPKNDCKAGIMSGMVHRAFRYCSTDEALKAELKFVKDTFIYINDYPVDFVEKHIERMAERMNESERIVL